LRGGGCGRYRTFGCDPSWCGAWGTCADRRERVISSARVRIGSKSVARGVRASEKLARGVRAK